MNKRAFLIKSLILLSVILIIVVISTTFTIIKAQAENNIKIYDTDTKTITIKNQF